MSSLIKLALADMRKAEAEPEKFILDMNTWLKPTTVICSTTAGLVLKEHKACILCAAGSVMAFSLKAPLSFGELAPLNMKGNTSQLDAINSLRSGDVTDAAYHLDLCPPRRPYAWFEKFDTDIPDYNRDKPEPFHKAMKRLQTRLAKAGL
jgi:hypothetical protein